MLKRLMLGAAISALVVTAPVLAADAPANPEDCLKSAFELAKLAEEKKLSNETLDQLETFFERMEQHCDAQRYSEAMSTATEIRDMIDKAKQ